MRRPANAVVVASAILLATSACGPDRQGPPVHPQDKAANRQQQFSDMMTRPDIDQITQRYNDMLTTLRDRLVAELGTNPWIERPNSSGSAGCGEYPDVEPEDKESRHTSRWALDRNLSDEKWPGAVQIFAEVTGAQGFETPPQVIVNQPGDHEITTADPFGGDVIFGTKLNSTLQARTGCHPTAEAHQRGTPSIPQYGR